MSPQDQKCVGYMWRCNISTYNNQHSENDMQGNIMGEDPNSGWDLVHDRADEGEDQLVFCNG
eukprot:217873-Ditylum_brightwellii.AAC.1